jgi:hypothetical protein
LTEGEIAVIEKGFITINTINRIENKQIELKKRFNDMGYWNTSLINKIWDYAQIFNVNEFQRIIDNIVVLKKAFFEYSYTPQVPPISYYFEDINSLEKILYDFDVMISDIKSNYRECDTFECGE